MAKLPKQAIVMFTEEYCTSSTQLKAKNLYLAMTLQPDELSAYQIDLHDQLLNKSGNFVY